MNIAVVRAGGAVMVGQTDDIVTLPITLHKPLMVLRGKEPGSIAFELPLGGADTMVVHANPEWAFFTTDEEFGKFYMEHIVDIPGLQIVQNGPGVGSC